MQPFGVFHSSKEYTFTVKKKLNNTKIKKVKAQSHLPPKETSAIYLVLVLLTFIGM